MILVVLLRFVILILVAVVFAALALRFIFPTFYKEFLTGKEKTKQDILSAEGIKKKKAPARQKRKI